MYDMECVVCAGRTSQKGILCVTCALLKVKRSVKNKKVRDIIYFDSYGVRFLIVRKKSGKILYIGDNTIFNLFLC